MMIRINQKWYQAGQLHPRYLIFWSIDGVDSVDAENVNIYNNVDIMIYILDPRRV